MGRVREEKGRRKKTREEKESEERRCRCAKRIDKSPNSVFFPMSCGSRGSKSRIAEAGEMRDEQLQAAVARSTCPSQHVQSRSCSGHVWYAVNDDIQYVADVWWQIAII